VSVSIGTDFFVELAKLRALRLTWKKIVSDSSSAEVPIFIHARSEPWLNPSYSPHGNMLKGTTAAMAAILGGCDVLSVEPEQDDQGMMSRAARNVSNLLREESYFSKVADPVAGSYFLEELTREIADEAWKKIKQQLPS
jgi:methylmalonyl-CoA mutase